MSEYRFRMFKSEDIGLKLTDNSIDYKNTKRGNGLIEYSDIKSVQLFSPAPEFYWCRIKTKSGKKIDIRNKTQSKSDSSHYITLNSHYNKRTAQETFII